MPKVNHSQAPYCSIFMFLIYFIYIFWSFRPSVCSLALNFLLERATQSCHKAQNFRLFLEKLIIGYANEMSFRFYNDRDRELRSRYKGN